jgi:hypothetical protein
VLKEGPIVKDKRRDLRAFRNAAARLKRQAMKHGLVCWLCGEPFDWTLDYRDPMSFTADHVAPLARGGAINGPLKPAHRACNARRGDGRRAERIPTTRRW